MTDMAIIISPKYRCFSTTNFCRLHENVTSPAISSHMQKKGQYTFKKNPETQAIKSKFKCPIVKN